MYFKTVTETFENLSTVSSRMSMTKMLAELLQAATPQEAEIICNLSLGLLRPPYKGTQFNFAHKNLIKIFADLLNISQEAVEQQAKLSGDLGLVVSTGMWHTAKQLTVTEVFNALVALEKIEGTGSQQEKGQHVLQLLYDVDPLSAKYIVRIMLNTLRLGFSDMTLIDALSWMQTGDKSLHDTIENAYNICADIGLIAKTLKETGIEGIKAMHIQIGIPIRPAAAERLPTAQAIIDKIGPCIAQPKLDGFRLQIHLDKTDPKHPIIKFFSRNLLDMSAMFPDLVESFLQLDVQTLICEGEAIVHDPHTGSFLPFQETVKRKRKHGIEQAIEDFPIQLYLFDMLYLNGNTYLTASHQERRDALLAVFAHKKSQNIHVIDEQHVTTAQELEYYFTSNIASGLEGLVVKKPNSEYKPGKRNFNWIKLKRQEEGHLEDTLDCVILGYYAGEGKRAHFGIGAFLVGAFNPEADCFQTIAKIGTGLTDTEWKALKKQCDDLHILQKPKNVACAKELYPDVWVDPEIVCSIRADEITLSPLHYAGKTETALGFALRFPRFMGLRPDKSSVEATTVSEVKRLYEDQFLKQKKRN